MSDLVGRLRSIADASRRDDGTDIPLGEYLREAATRIEQLEAALQEAITRMTEAARDAGHWKGKYEAAGYPGTLDGWIEKAKALEAENARLRTVLLNTRAIVVDGSMTGFNVLDGDWADRLYANNGTISAALAGKAGT